MKYQVVEHKSKSFLSNSLQFLPLSRYRSLKSFFLYSCYLLRDKKTFMLRLSHQSNTYTSMTSLSHTVGHLPLGCTALFLNMFYVSTLYVSTETKCSGVGECVAVGAAEWFEICIDRKMSTSTWFMVTTLLECIYTTNRRLLYSWKSRCFIPVLYFRMLLSVLAC